MSISFDTLRNYAVAEFSSLNDPNSSSSEALEVIASGLNQLFFLGSQEFMIITGMNAPLYHQYKDSFPPPCIVSDVLNIERTFSFNAFEFRKFTQGYNMLNYPVDLDMAMSVEGLGLTIDSNPIAIEAVK